MTPREREILEDMQAYIQFELDQDTKSGGEGRLTKALGTLSHDVGGLLRGDECMAPRTTGYAEHMQKCPVLP